MCWFQQKLMPYLNKFDWLPGLLSRAILGFIFVQSGWGKFQHLDRVVEFFSSLGIPAAKLQAPFVAGVELVCGGLVLLGLATRVASVPLIGTMVVAIITAKWNDVHEVADLFGMSEFLYIVLLLWLILKGAGLLSVDYFWSRRCEQNKP